ncbi:MAG TPA: hypothetical protein P5077_00345 [bacterium]|nr:hypothetical protein [bacterium]
MTKKARHDLSLPEPMLLMIEVRSRESGESKNQCIQKLLEKGLQYEREHSTETKSNIAQPTVNLEPLQEQMNKIQRQLDTILKSQEALENNSETRHKSRYADTMTIMEALKIVNGNVLLVDKQANIIRKKLGENITGCVNKTLDLVTFMYSLAIEDIGNKDYSEKIKRTIKGYAAEIYNSHCCREIIEKPVAK